VGDNFIDDFTVTFTNRAAKTYLRRSQRTRPEYYHLAWLHSTASSTGKSTLFRFPDYTTGYRKSAPQSRASSRNVQLLA
jgi:hypothetical protein